jgi:hypothetical protein
LGVLGLLTPQNLMDVFHESPLFMTVKRIKGWVNDEHWQAGYPSNMPLVLSGLADLRIAGSIKKPHS